MKQPEQFSYQEKDFYQEALGCKTEPFVLAEIGHGAPIVAVTGGMHGNERTGVDILYALKDELPPLSGTVRLVVANPQAVVENVRFRNEDLNRVFPGDIHAQGERRLAHQVLELVKDSDYTIDLHATGALTEGFVILGRKNKQRLEFAEATGIRKIVLIEAKYDCAMADFVNCGIGIETGLQGTGEAFDIGYNGVLQALARLGMSAGISEKPYEHEYYEVYGNILREAHMAKRMHPTFKNFQYVHSGDPLVEMYASTGERVYLHSQEGFYPLFGGESAYKDSICTKARQISRELIMGGVNL